MSGAAGGINPPGGEAAAGGGREVEVTVVESHHLPKKDLMGKCDAFCIVDFAGQTWKTTVKQKAYEAEWNEAHVFSVPDASAAPGELRVTVKDDDMVSGSDLVPFPPWPHALSKRSEGGLSRSGEEPGGSRRHRCSDALS